MAHFVINTKGYARELDGTCQVIIRYVYKGVSHPKSISGLRCKADELDPVTQLITKGYDRPTMKRMNERIKDIKGRAQDVLREFEEPEPDLFFHKLFEEYKEQKKKSVTCLLTLYQKWLKEEANSNVYSTTLPHILDFKESRGGQLLVEEYGKGLLKEFEKHLMENGYVPYDRRVKGAEIVGEKREGKRVMFKHSAMKKHLKHFKFFGKYLTDLELPINQNFRDYRFSISTPDMPDTIALTKAEFDQLFYFDLSNNFDLNLAKSAFIIGTAAGGIRVSDLYKLTADSFDLDNYSVRFTQEKTGGDVFNPLSREYIQPHLEFYLDNLHKMPVEQEFNRRLKEIGNLIKWERTETVNEYRGDNKKPTKVKVAIKDHISSKYMRKTFISIMVELGYSKEIIKGFTGHKDDKVIDHYIQVHQHTKRAAIEGFSPGIPDK